MRFFGLVLWIAVLEANVAGILLDFLLLVGHCETVTAYARKYPILAIAILLLQLAAFVGLALHFFPDTEAGK